MHFFSMVFLVIVKKCVYHGVVAPVSCEPEPHVQLIRTNQKAVIRAWWWWGGDGSIAVGELYDPWLGGQTDEEEHGSSCQAKSQIWTLLLFLFLFFFTSTCDRLFSLSQQMDKTGFKTFLIYLFFYIYSCYTVLVWFATWSDAITER